MARSRYPARERRAARQRAQARPASIALAVAFTGFGAFFLWLASVGMVSPPPLLTDGQALAYAADVTLAFVMGAGSLAMAAALAWEARR